MNSDTFRKKLTIKCEFFLFYYYLLSIWVKVKKANTLMRFPDTDLSDTYSNPIIDTDCKYWFIVNSKVSSLVDLTKCVQYDEIILPKKSI